MDRWIDSYVYIFVTFPLGTYSAQKQTILEHFESTGMLT